jgi:MoaA/NifB/PqqE/SkfB family radical SAM enzyme
MEPELIYSIVDRIVDENLDTSLTCCLLGESLLHPDIYNIFSYIVAHKVPFYVTTNTSIWNDKVFDLLTNENSCYQIILSNNGLWGRKSKSLEVCMPGIDRQKSKNHIDMIIAMKNRKRSKTQVGIKIIRRGQDQEEIENLIYYWLNDGGADFVAVGKLLESAGQKMRMYPCRHFDDMAMYIRSDGTLIPCGWNTKITNDLVLTLGKMSKDLSIENTYNNLLFGILRKRHQEGDFPYPCNECTIAYTGDGFEGVVRFRDKKKSRRKIYYHDDYSNTFYSYQKKRTRVSFLR